MQFFLAIIVFPFAKLRKKYQLCLEALEQYEQGATISTVTLFFNLITFRLVELKKLDPDQQAKDYKAQEEEILKSQNLRKIEKEKKRENDLKGDRYGDLTGKHKERKMSSSPMKALSGKFEKSLLLAKNKVQTVEPQATQIEQSKESKDNLVRGWNKKKMYHILKSNLEIITGKVAGGHQIVSRDSYIDKMDNIIRYYEKKRLNSVNKKVKEVTTQVFMNLVSSIVYFVYIIIFISMLTRQLENTNSFKSAKAFESLVKSVNFRYVSYTETVDYTKIVTLNDYRTWLGAVKILHLAKQNISRRWQKKIFPLLQPAIWTEQCFRRVHQGKLGRFRVHSECVGGQ